MQSQTVFIFPNKDLGMTMKSTNWQTNDQKDVKYESLI